MIKIIKVIFGMPVNCYNSVVLNILGMQFYRYLILNIINKIKGVFFFNETNKYSNDLPLKGIVALDSFFSQSDFLKIKKIYENQIKTVDIDQDKKNLGLIWKSKIINLHNADEESLWVLKKFQDNEKINNIIKNILKKKNIEPPNMINFQYIENQNIDDTNDQDLVIHSDRFYNCVKLSFYINDNNDDNGCYKYSEESHLFTLKRALHEYIFSILYSFLKSFNLTIIKSSIEKGRIKPLDIFNYNKKMKSYCGSENTLIISNQKGFHARGSIAKGKIRKQIRMTFYNNNRPYITNFLKKISNF